MIDIVLSERILIMSFRHWLQDFFPGVHNRVLIQPEQEDAALFELAERGVRGRHFFADRCFPGTV